jgi:hypothetical protein
LKSCMIRYTLVAASALALLLPGGGARAISTGAETEEPPVVVPGATQKTLPAQTYIGLSPETTVFTFRIPVRDSQGHTSINTVTDLGTTLVAEKLFYLQPSRAHHDVSTASLGAWYWYHNSQTDRLSVYGKYFYNSRVGGQLNIGGDTHLGLFEYYAFFLYNAKKQTKLSPVGIQLGIGPYLNRRNGKTATFSGGDPGVTGLVDITYTQSPRISYSGELWYVNYHAPARDLGLSTTDSLVRFYAGINYKL